MSPAWVRLAAVARKEGLQTARDRRIVFMLVVAPLVQTILFGFAVDFQVDRVPAAVVDADRTPESRLHLRRLLADGTLSRARTLGDGAAALDALDRGEAALAVVLRPGFGEDLLAGRTARAQVVLDGTDPNRATVAGGAVSRYFGERGAELAAARAGRELPLRLVPRIAYNPSLRTPPFMIPGVLAMLLVVVTTIVTAMGLARERESGTLEQVLVTPLAPAELLAGKMVPFLVVGLFDVLLVLTVGALVFDLPLRGSLAVLAAGTLLYLLTTLGVGLLISTMSRNQQQAFLGGFLFTLPAVLLAGVVTPISSMPPPLRLVTFANPLRYYAEVSRAVLQKGAGAAELWPQLAALAVFGLAIFGAAALRFRRRLA
ncbi:ABC transporter permease [Anaeromyxobacter paludicola]|uniref:Antibiotic ABC transporter permease n=1 Tax=Anaeromyxobacter paludicola TaxID=2918171 RepID=A0ABM7XFA9_9BACT|nr:ABC transporter permease [Anaeromyxobacter paludicola]BDG10555.1 antibiotic ABC transporter permease [Anaeromyxobacter paludicola]